MNKMNFKKLEAEVMCNSIKLDLIMPSLMKNHKDKYVVFNEGVKFFTDDFGKAVDLGIKEFGEDVGFVATKVTNIKPFFSLLVKL